jgi:HipA-like C-terminal domain
MLSTFPIIEVTPAMRSDSKVEQLGSKPKFWFTYEKEKWLFKEARQNTGEDWSEKLASEIAKLMGLSTHHTELAIWNGKRGCAVKSFLPQGFSLVHGNELLGGLLSGYDSEKIHGQADHTVENIVNVLERIFLGDSSRAAVSRKFIGYLVFDALVGNTDRHHQNWGLIINLPENKESANPIVALAPTFDHASSLGRELTDEARARHSKEQTIERYTLRARGGIFENVNSSRGMSPMSLATLLAVRYPQFFKPWQTSVKNLNPNDFKTLIERISSDRISLQGKEFAHALLLKNTELLLNIK